MRVHVDRTRCSGIGLCEMTAPAIFEIGDDGQSRLIKADPPDSDRRAAEDAMANCPTGALSIED